MHPADQQELERQRNMLLEVETELAETRKQLAQAQERLRANEKALSEIAQRASQAAVGM